MNANTDTTELDTLELLSREVAKITSRESAPKDMSISELGVDSLSIVELMVFCEQLYGLFDPTSLSITEYTTLTDLDRMLHSAAAA